MNIEKLLKEFETKKTDLCKVCEMDKAINNGYCIDCQEAGYILGEISKIKKRKRHIRRTGSIKGILKHSKKRDTE